MKKSLFAATCLASGILFCSSCKLEAGHHRHNHGYVAVNVEQAPARLAVPSDREVIVTRPAVPVVERRAVYPVRERVVVRPAPVAVYREPVVIVEEPVREVVIVQPRPRSFFSLGFLFGL